jgi:hypothetical protein
MAGRRGARRRRRDRRLRRQAATQAASVRVAAQLPERGASAAVGRAAVLGGAGQLGAAVLFRDVERKKRGSDGLKRTVHLELQLQDARWLAHTAQASGLSREDVVTTLIHAAAASQPSPQPQTERAKAQGRFALIVWSRERLATASPVVTLFADRETASLAAPLGDDTVWSVVDIAVRPRERPRRIRPPTDSQILADRRKAALAAEGEANRRKRVDGEDTP